jgi:hypothetical protein
MAINNPKKRGIKSVFPKYNMTDRKNTTWRYLTKVGSGGVFSIFLTLVNCYTFGA